MQIIQSSNPVYRNVMQWKIKIFYIIKIGKKKNIKCSTLLIKYKTKYLNTEIKKKIKYIQGVSQNVVYI
jgi:hypothetical protein